MTYISRPPPNMNSIQGVCDSLRTNSLTSFFGKYWATGWLRWIRTRPMRDYLRSLIWLAQGWNASLITLCPVLQSLILLLLLLFLTVLLSLLLSYPPSTSYCRALTSLLDFPAPWSLPVCHIPSAPFEPPSFLLPSPTPPSPSWPIWPDDTEECKKWWYSAKSVPVLPQATAKHGCRLGSAASCQGPA